MVLCPSCVVRSLGNPSKKTHTYLPWLSQASATTHDPLPTDPGAICLWVYTDGFATLQDTLARNINAAAASRGGYLLHIQSGLRRRTTLCSNSPALHQGLPLLSSLPCMVTLNT